jgi:hypothetical protein
MTLAMLVAAAGAGDAAGTQLTFRVMALESGRPEQRGCRWWTPLTVGIALAVWRDRASGDPALPTGSAS